MRFFEVDSEMSELLRDRFDSNERVATVITRDAANATLVRTHQKIRVRRRVKNRNVVAAFRNDGREVTDRLVIVGAAKAGDEEDERLGAAAPDKSVVINAGPTVIAFGVNLEREERLSLKKSGRNRFE